MPPLTMGLCESCESSDERRPPSADQLFDLHVVKIVVVGGSRVGKRSLVRALATQQPVSSDLGAHAHDATRPPVEFTAMAARSYGRRLQVGLNVIAGAVDPRRMPPHVAAYVRDAAGCICVADVTRPDTIDAVVRWRAAIEALRAPKLSSGWERLTPPRGRGGGGGNGGAGLAPAAALAPPMVIAASKCDVARAPANALAYADTQLRLQEVATDGRFVLWRKTSAFTREAVDEVFQTLLDTVAEDHAFRKR